MKTATKIGLLALGSAAAMVAIVAMTLHEDCLLYTSDAADE